MVQMEKVTTYVTKKVNTKNLSGYITTDDNKSLMIAASTSRTRWWS